MAMEPGFRNIKEGFTGFYIWRVEVNRIFYNKWSVKRTRKISKTSELISKNINHLKLI